MKRNYEYRLSDSRYNPYTSFRMRDRQEYLNSLKIWGAIWGMIVVMCVCAFWRGV